MSNNSNKQHDDVSDQDALRPDSTNNIAAEPLAGQIEPLAPLPPPVQEKLEVPAVGTYKKWPALLGLLLVFLLIVVGLWLANRPKPGQLQGMVEADSFNVATKVPSRVNRLLVEEGEQVKAGQVLATLSSPELEAKQQQAEASLQSARALDQTAKRGSREENIASLHANWQSLLAQAQLADSTYKRSKNLFDEGVISRQRYEESLAAKNSAAQGAEAARQQYLRAERGSTPEQLSSADAQLKIAQAAVFEASALNKETRLISPVDGEVDKKFANPGELVAAGIPLYTVINSKDQWVSIHLKEDEFYKLKMGDVLHGDVPALQAKNIAFKVSHIAAEGSFATWKATRESSGYDIRTFAIKLKPQQAVEGLRPGMSVLFTWPQQVQQASH